MLAVWTSWRLNILSSPAMNAIGEKISPCRTPLAMFNGLESAILPSACLVRTTPVAAAKMASSRHMCMDPCLRQVLVQEELAFNIESDTVINERDYSLPVIPEYHLYEPFHSMHTRCFGNPALAWTQLAYKKDGLPASPSVCALLWLTSACTNDIRGILLDNSRNRLEIPCVSSLFCVVVEAQRTKLNSLLYIAKHIIVWEGLVIPQPGYSNCECKI